MPVYDNSRFSALANGSLAIANITQREQGFYLCSAKNAFGSELSKLAKISVHGECLFLARLLSCPDASFSLSRSHKCFRSLRNKKRTNERKQLARETEPAKFSAKYKTLEVRIEEQANLVCVASGEPPLSVEWRNKHDKPIQASDKRFM